MRRNFFKQLLIVGTLAVLSLFGTISARAADDKVTELQNKAKAQLNQLPSTNAEDIIGLAIRILTMFMGAIMFGLVVYGGILWMTANGNGDKITQAKNIIVWAALGVVVMLVSYVVINFVLKTIG